MSNSRNGEAIVITIFLRSNKTIRFKDGLKTKLINKDKN